MMEVRQGDQGVGETRNSSSSTTPRRDMVLPYALNSRPAPPSCQEGISVSSCVVSNTPSHHSPLTTTLFIPVFAFTTGKYINDTCAGLTKYLPEKRGSSGISK